jgi:hypothetical protein
VHGQGQLLENDKTNKCKQTQRRQSPNPYIRVCMCVVMGHCRIVVPLSTLPFLSLLFIFCSWKKKNLAPPPPLWQRLTTEKDNHEKKHWFAFTFYSIPHSLIHDAPHDTNDWGLVLVVSYL